MSDRELHVEYVEGEDERVVVYELGDRQVEIATPRRGYGMLVVRRSNDGELERYYGLDMAVDHAAEVLGLPPSELSIPEAASDFGI